MKALNFPAGILALLFAACLFAAPHARAQATAKVLSNCGSASYTAGTFNYLTQDTTGAQCGGGGGGGGGSGATAIITPTGSSAYGITPSATTANPASGCFVYKAAPGNGYDFSGVAGTTGYIMLFDAASAPSNGTVTPKAEVAVSAGGSWSISYGSIAGVFSTGITACNSSTGPYTLTAAVINNFFTGRYQ